MCSFCRKRPLSAQASVMLWLELATQCSPQLAQPADKLAELTRTPLLSSSAPSPDNTGSHMITYYTDTSMLSDLHANFPFCSSTPIFPLFLRRIVQLSMAIWPATYADIETSLLL